VLVIERPILEATRLLRQRGEPFVIATVARVRGSAYRRPGARMIVTQDGWIAGSVSGGCLEGDVTRRAWWLTEQRPAIITYDSRAAHDADPDELAAAFGLGCGGVIDVLLERHAPAAAIDAFALADRWHEQQHGGAIATVLDASQLGDRFALCEDGARYGDPDPAIVAALAGAIGSGRTRVQSIGGRELLVESVQPPPRLFVFGAGHDVVPVVRFARQLGWEVIVCARTGRHRVRERFVDADAIAIGKPDQLAPEISASYRALAVVMSHDFDHDRASVEMLLGSRAQYIGVLGPRARTDRLLGTRHDPRIHAPVGLELGAETPDEIALSIVSEIQAALTRMPATNLREHVGPIHASVS
jgi:xanthine dehydrogenase accessory factor